MIVENRNKEKDFIGTFQWICLWVLMSFLVGMFYPYDYFGEGKTIFLLVVYAFSSLFLLLHIITVEIELPRLFNKKGEIT